MDCTLHLQPPHKASPVKSFAGNICRVSGQAVGWLALARNCLPLFLKLVEQGSCSAIHALFAQAFQNKTSRRGAKFKGRGEA